jgi:aldehyde:ferredoxin oxidoreductase
MSFRILRVNLSNRTYHVEELSEEVFKKFLLGRGIGDYILYKEVNPAIDPYSSENKLVFATGPFSGTTVPGAARLSAVTKSPLTGTKTSTNAGGHFGMEMALDDYHVIIIEGASDSPVYLFIKGDEVIFGDASKLWGKSTSESDTLLKKLTHPKSKTLVIGPAGENLSPIAGIFVDGHRALGRGGAGGVMGSKKLKGIAILGKSKIGFKGNAQKYKDLINKLYGYLRQSEGLKRFKAFGTTGNVRTINLAGSFPTRNFRDSYLEGYENINGTEVNRLYLVKAGACAQCPVSCNRITKVEYDGKIYLVSGPEYETLWSFGGATGVTDLKYVILAHHLANEYGFDGISLGSTIACLMDLYEDGHVKDLPFEAKFGDGEAMVKLIELAGKNEGIGALIKEGSLKLASHFGHPEYSMSVKGQEIPAYDPRGIKGMGIGYATSTRGACHLRGFNTSQEVYNAPDPEYRLKYTDEKVDFLIHNQNVRALQDSLGICAFVGGYYELEDYSTLIESLWGISIGPEDLYRAGERVWNIENLYNRKAGISRVHDTLPERIFSLPVKSGPSSGEAYDKSEFERLLNLYYHKRGWNQEGWPEFSKLKELGIE